MGLEDGSTVAWEANTSAWNIAGAAVMGAGDDGTRLFSQCTNWSAVTVVDGPALLSTEISPTVTARNSGVADFGSDSAVKAVTSLLEMATTVSPIEKFSP